ncbi:alpha/beta hydrolase [Streptomyces sp. NBC_00059]|uniref:alpha/beta hydrolase n=1 Tax=Streptomyces sp. NBC_00059 TaxID=2975635 RepID=UPI00224F70D5|nr:alpha/beta hydrolase [Streptomyces sp. NBC_00059]MCX5415768.1 alpha/beta hydrolase [Streptomyces sp. NBC_00059]
MAVITGLAVAPAVHASPSVTGPCGGRRVPIRRSREPTANPQHRLDAHGAPPILVSNALHDPATGYAWAVSVTRQLGRSGVLLTNEGHGHGSVTRGPCMEDAVDSYLTDLTVPPRGTSCPAVPS